MSSMSALKDSAAVRVLSSEARKQITDFFGAIPEGDGSAVTIEITAGTLKLAVKDGKPGCNAQEITIETKRYGA